MEVKISRKIDPYLDTIFNIRYSNYRTNEIIREKALKNMIKVIDSLAPKGYLDDIPMKILRIQRNPYGKGALVHFYSDNKSEIELISDNVQFDLIGFMDEKMGESINEKSTYFVKSKKYKRLTETEVFSIVKQVYYSPDPKIEADIIQSSKFNFRLGDFMCVVDTIIPVRK